MILGVIVEDSLLSTYVKIQIDISKNGSARNFIRFRNTGNLRVTMKSRHTDTSIGRLVSFMCMTSRIHLD